MRTALISTFVMLQLVGCSGPMGPIPGKELEGIATPWPADWTFTEDIENVLLQTNPQDPYSVTVWGVHQNSNFYIAGANPDSNWVENIQRDGQVVLSVENKLYNALAMTVTDAEELSSVLTLFVGKYEIEPDSTFIEDGGVLFRLSPTVASVSSSPEPTHTQ
ncbi:MAG: hypothetical protein AAF993_08500 [Pseudomonadota bacterium]